MNANNEVAGGIEKGVCRVHTQTEIKSKQDSVHQENVKDVWYTVFYENTPIILHYTLLFIIGLLVWGLLWLIFGNDWAWDGACFRMVLIACAAWAAGLSFQSLTTLPPQLAALLVGILAGNLGYLDMREHSQFDELFRKIIPVVILGKSSLLWDFKYMKDNWLQVASLGVLPWTMEASTVAVFTHLFLKFPWSWGFSFGSFYACVSIPVIVPIIVGLPKSGEHIKKWMQIVCNSGGIDVTLSVVTYGMIKSVTTADVSEIYRYIRFFLTPFVGILVGVLWGLAAGFVPHPRDYYVNELRILFVLLGGLFLNFLSVYLDWGGAALLALLICNATAMKYWAKQGWSVLNNPVATGYRALWSACEPSLFAYTGTFFVFSRVTYNTVIHSLILMLVCTVVRLTVVFIVSWKKTVRQRLFICCCWSPKAIVQAVISPIRISAFIVYGATEEEQLMADNILNITIITILISTPLSFIATKFLAHILLKEEENGKEQNGGV